MWAVYPTRLERSAKVRVCVEFLQEHFALAGWMASAAGSECAGASVGPFALSVSQGCSRRAPWLRQAQPERMGRDSSRMHLSSKNSRQRLSGKGKQLSNNRTTPQSTLRPTRWRCRGSGRRRRISRQRCLHRCRHLAHVGLAGQAGLDHAHDFAHVARPCSAQLGHDGFHGSQGSSADMRSGR